MPRSHLAGLFLYTILFRLHERRASPPRQDLAIQYPRSRLGGLEIAHVNAIKRASHSRWAGGNNRIDIEQWVRIFGAKISSPARRAGSPCKRYVKSSPPNVNGT